MTDIKQAVKAARDFAGELFAEGELKDLRVEEIEHDEQQGKWLVTLGWVEPAVKQIGGFAAIAGPLRLEPLPRVYKVFRVDAVSGQVESMKMR